MEEVDADGPRVESNDVEDYGIAIKAINLARSNAGQEPTRYSVAYNNSSNNNNGN